MIFLKSESLELRGVARKESKNGKVYHTVNLEQEDGTACSFYAPDESAFYSGMKKGDKVVIEFRVDYFRGNEKLIVNKIVKA